jgi:uncharacterized membrane protein YoaK (UPF0700 family)
VNGPARGICLIFAMHFFKGLAARDRTQRSNLRLVALLASVAGAINAGGFFAVKQYTSHMSGIWASLVNEIVLGNLLLVCAGLSLLLSFIFGAVTTTIMIDWARGKKMHSELACPILLESMLILGFGMLGANLDGSNKALVPGIILLLCFVMGLQNAIVNEASSADIRTTHMTGVLTDLGMELGRLMYWKSIPAANAFNFADADWKKLRVHLTILGFFFSGAVVGAISFRWIGFYTTIPVAAFLILVALPPLLQDIGKRMQKSKGVL